MRSVALARLHVLPTRSCSSQAVHSCACSTRRLLVSSTSTIQQLVPNLVRLMPLTAPSSRISLYATGRISAARPCVILIENSKPSRLSIRIGGRCQGILPSQITTQGVDGSTRILLGLYPSRYCTKIYNVVYLLVPLLSSTCLQTCVQYLVPLMCHDVVSEAD